MARKKRRKRSRRRITKILVGRKKLNSGVVWCVVARHADGTKSSRGCFTARAKAEEKAHSINKRRAAALKGLRKRK